MNTSKEARLWTAIFTGMEGEGIRPVKIYTAYSVMIDGYNVRVDHIPSKTTVIHDVWSSYMDLPPDKLAVQVIDPIVMKMLEALTS